MGSVPKKISASRMAAILGLSEFSTPLDVFQNIEEELHPGWNSAHGFILPENKDSAPLRWGNAFETAVIKLAEISQGSKIHGREKVFSSGVMTCHLDGLYADGTIHEGKTTTAFSYRLKWGEPGTDHIPQSYQIQTQMQMMLAKRDLNIVSVLVFPDMPDVWEYDGWTVEKNGSVFSLIKRDKASNAESRNPFQWAEVMYDMGFFHQYMIHADKEAQKFITQFADEFWNKNIIPGIPPDVKTVDDVKRLFPVPVGTIVCPDDVTAMFQERKSITEEIGIKGTLPMRKDELTRDILDWARKQDACFDDESRDKTVFMSRAGEKLGQWNGKMFR
jgi:hypothetical protein